MPAIPAIPTTYAGVNFRSRLEARWAAFFDILGWQWDYEPIDLAGYIPDFIVHGARPVPLLLETKPLNINSSFGRDGMGAAITAIADSGWRGAAAVVGAVPRSCTPVWEPRAPRSLVFGRWVPDVCSEQSDPERGDWIFPFEVARDHLGGWCLAAMDSGSAADVLPLWRESGNRVQWRPAR